MVANIWDLYKEKHNFCIAFSVCVCGSLDCDNEFKLQRQQFGLELKGVT